MLNYKVKSVPMKKTLALIVLRFCGFAVLPFSVFHLAPRKCYRINFSLEKKFLNDEIKSVLIGQTFAFIIFRFFAFSFGLRLPRPSFLALLYTK
jgi:hypothetical protein